MNYSSKDEFLRDVEQAWEDLWQQVDPLTDDQLTKRPAGGSSIKDALAHLYCWHRLAIGWYRDGLAGQPDLPAEGYNWGQTRALNQQLCEECRDWELASVRRKLKLSHNRIMKIVDGLTEEQLLASGHFAWTKKLGLISYISANTSSHYRWAKKKIKSILKS